MQIWDATTGNAVYTQTDTEPFFAVAWSPDGARLAAATGDNITCCNGRPSVGKVVIWDAASNKTLLTYTQHTKELFALRWSPNGKALASGGDDNSVRVWNATTGALITTYTQHSAAIWGLSWSPDGTRIASASQDETVQVWAV